MDIAVVPEASEREVAEVGGDGCTEHKSLGGGTFTQNLLQFILEFALSEQLVGLVEDNRLHSRQLEVGFSEQLHQPSRSGDDDVGIDGETLELPLVGVSSEDEGVPEVDLMQEGLEHLGDLVREVSRGDEYERPRAVDLRVRLQFVDEGEQVGQSLSGTRLVGDHHVLALHHQRNGLLLHWRRIAQLVDHQIQEQLREEGVLREAILLDLRLCRLHTALTLLPLALRALQLGLAHLDLF